MEYVCSAWNKVKSWWAPVEKPALLEPLNPRQKIMDPPPTLKQLEKQLKPRSSQDLDKVIYFYKPKNKLP